MLILLDGLFSFGFITLQIGIGIPSKLWKGVNKYLSVKKTIIIIPFLSSPALPLNSAEAKFIDRVEY